VSDTFKFSPYGADQKRLDKIQQVISEIASEKKQIHLESLLLLQTFSPWE